MKANKEFIIFVDRDGNVTEYASGGKSSVGVNPHKARNATKGTMLIHNHPNSSTFSVADMNLISDPDYKPSRNFKGIIASGRNGDYIITKNGGHFKQAQFFKAVQKTENMSNSETRDWLKKNQKKYGYKFEFKLSKEKKKQFGIKY